MIPPPPQPPWAHHHRRVFPNRSLPHASIEYSDTNEDLASSLRALQGQPGHIVVGITGSADLPLLALQHDPAFVAAYDLNPAQNALGELKRAAIAHLPYPDYLALFGYRPSSRRQALLQTIASELPDDIRTFWQRPDMVDAVEHDFWRCGTATRQDLASWEASLRQLHARIGPHDLNLTLGLHGTPDQRQAIRTRVARTDDKYLEPAIRNNNHFKFDPFRYPEGMANVPAVARFAAPYLPPDRLAPPISEQAFHRIRDRLHRISFQTASIADALQEMPDEAFDRAYLSNIAEYLPVSEERALADLLIDKGRPDAIVVLLYLALTPAQHRDLLDHRAWSERGLSRFLRTSDWSERLPDADQIVSNLPKAKAWARNLGKSVDSLSQGGAAEAAKTVRRRLEGLTGSDISVWASRSARRTASRARQVDYASASRRAAGAVQSALEHARNRVAETRQLEDRDHILVEHEDRTAALWSDVHANLRASAASKSFYGFEYAILHRVPRDGPTYRLPPAATDSRQTRSR